MTADQRALFVAELAVSGNLTFSCAVASVTRREALSERDGHPGFERAWRQAEDEARHRFALRKIMNYN